MDIVVKKIDEQWFEVEGTRVSFKALACELSPARGGCNRDVGGGEMCPNPISFDEQACVWKCQPSGHLVMPKIPSWATDLTPGVDYVRQVLDAQELDNLRAHLDKLRVAEAKKAPALQARDEFVRDTGGLIEQVRDLGQVVQVGNVNKG